MYTVLGQQRTTSCGEKISKKLDLGDCKLAFLKPNHQSMDKNLSGMIHIRREILGEDKNIIQVDEAERKITQNLIHKALECVTSVFEAKGHAKELEHPKGGSDGGFLNVLQRNRYLIVTFLEVQLGKKHCRSFNSQGEIGDVG